MWYLHAELHHLGSSARLALGTGRWLELGTMFAARVLKATGLLPVTPTCITEHVPISLSPLTQAAACRYCRQHHPKNTALEAENFFLPASQNNEGF